MVRPGDPPASSPEAQRRMQATRRRDTAPEIALRSSVHRLGLRYRVDRSPLPNVRRRADLVFFGARVAVYVDGCFWHGCPLHATWPKANADWWRAKLDANQQRDADTDAQLARAGWIVVRCWEHEDPDEAASRVAQVVGARRRSPGSWSDQSSQPKRMS
jgi:DNA mismatch endonuclease (patch repair protein)